MCLWNLSFPDKDSICNIAVEFVISQLLIFSFIYTKCLLWQIAQHGILKASLGMIVCFIVYFFIVSVWNRVVLGYAPEEWKMALVTVVQVLVTAFLYGFVYF